MPDQANNLRRLAIERTRPRAARPAGRPHWIVVAGGKGGVGTSTIAINLAVALADVGHATLLVDADPRDNLAMLCGIEERYTLDDLLAARRSVAEVVAAGPGGIQIVAGSRGWDESGIGSATIADRLIEVLDSGDVKADLVVIDAGNTTSPTVRRLWQAANAAVMVATPDAASVVGAYESIKVLTSSGAICLLVNRATPTVAATVYGRVARACRRFLGVRLESAGHAPSVRQAENGSKKLNIRPIGADKKRELPAADVLLKWKRHADSDGRGAKSSWSDSMPESRPFACQTEEKDFLQQVP
jgi:flagellar biosynthesis protein FlhG